MDTLFTEMENEAKSKVAPLAVRMRPRSLDELVGQQEAVGPGSWLRSAIEQDKLSSVILFGPAGGVAYSTSQALNFLAPTNCRWLARPRVSAWMAGL